MSSEQILPVLGVERLAFSWRDKPVLRDVSLSLEPGRILALLGPNGAGKSTLIRCICGRLRPDAGAVDLAGANPLDSAAARSALGLVPQQIALYPHLTVRENLLSFARLAGLNPSASQSAVAETIEVCDLGEVVEEAAGKLSGGWQRRVNIAAGLSHAPKVLILDEPTVGVDPPAREAIEVLLRRLADQGLAVLMTSHDLAQLEGMVDEVAYLAEGRIAAQGEPAGLIAEHFGDARDVHLTLAAPPDDQTAQRLIELGLVAGGVDQGLWSGLLPASLAATLQAQLSALPDVLEFRLRRPGLATLWTRLYGHAPEPSA